MFTIKSLVGNFKYTPKLYQWTCSQNKYRQLSCQLHRIKQLSKYPSHQKKRNLHSENVKIPGYVSTKSRECEQLITRGDLLVIDNFVNESEELSLLDEVEPYLARLQYESSHWDDAIHVYRETERSAWNESNSHIINRINQTAFSNTDKPTKFVHVLDLKADGEIKPHIDSTRYCGDTIAGVSLLSNSVMRLTKHDDTSVYIDLLLRRRSLYIMRSVARYEYTHELLHNDSSYFKGNHIERSRRISIICRNNPTANL